MSWIDFITSNADTLLNLVWEHLHIVGVSLLASLVIGITIGLFISRHDRIAAVVLSILGVIMTIPSLAMFALMIPFLGIGLEPAWMALTLYALLPIVQNTYVAVKNVDESTIEAGQGMGMTDLQIMMRVQLPLALPVIIAGVRTAVILMVGIAAIAAYIGAGGLGEYILWGMYQLHDEKIIAGALTVSILAISCDLLMSGMERALVPKGIRERR